MVDLGRVSACLEWSSGNVAGRGGWGEITSAHKSTPVDFISGVLGSHRCILSKGLILKYLHFRKSILVAGMIDRREWSLEPQGSHIYIMLCKPLSSL